jgi:hypothetical protein
VNALALFIFPNSLKVISPINFPLFTYSHSLPLSHIPLFTFHYPIHCPYSPPQIHFPLFTAHYPLPLFTHIRFPLFTLPYSLHRALPYALALFTDPFALPLSTAPCCRINVILVNNKEVLSANRVNFD